MNLDNLKILSITLYSRIDKRHGYTNKVVIKRDPKDVDN